MISILNETALLCSFYVSFNPLSIEKHLRFSMDCKIDIFCSKRNPFVALDFQVTQCHHICIYRVLSRCDTPIKYTCVDQLHRTSSIKRPLIQISNIPSFLNSAIKRQLNTFRFYRNIFFKHPPCCQQSNSNLFPSNQNSEKHKQERNTTYPFHQSASPPNNNKHYSTSSPSAAS